MAAGPSHMYVSEPDEGRPEPLGNIEYRTAVRPVTIRQLQQSTHAHDDAPWLIEGKEVASFIVVASLFRETLDASRHKATYELNDGTGKISAYRSFPSPQGRNAVQSMSEEEARAWESSVYLNADYVRIVGKLVKWGNMPRPAISVISIQKVVNFTEVLHHVLNALAVTLVYERGLPPPEVMQAARNRAAGTYVSQGVQSGVNVEAAFERATRDVGGRENAGASQTIHQLPGVPQAGEMLQENRSAPTTPHQPVTTNGTLPQADQSGGHGPAGPQPVQMPPSSGRSFADTPDANNVIAPNTNSARSASIRVANNAELPSRSGSPSTDYGTPMSMASELPAEDGAMEASPTPVPPLATPRPQRVLPPATPETPTGPEPERRRSRLNGGHTVHRDPLSHLNTVERQILLTIMTKAPDSGPEGVDVGVIATGLRNIVGIDSEIIESALDRLVNNNMIAVADGEGLFYTLVGDVAYSHSGFI